MNDLYNYYVFVFLICIDRFHIQRVYQSVTVDDYKQLNPLIMSFSRSGASG